MPEIAIVTDSDSSLPAGLAAQMGIRQVPITIHFPDRSYSAGVDLDDRQAFELVDRLRKIPTTAAPAPAAFAAAYEAAFAEGAQAVVCVCVSSKISATHAAALSAAEQMGGRTVRVIDSLNLSMGQGFMALEAAEATAQGASLDQVCERVQALNGRLHTYAFLPTLKYLAMSGRVGKLAAGIGNTLNIQPILSVKDGKLELLERIRTRARAFERVLQLAAAAAQGKPVQRAAIIHSAAPEAAAEMEARLRQTLDCPEKVIIAEFSAGLSVHAGLGVVGVVIQTA